MPRPAPGRVGADPTPDASWKSATPSAGDGGAVHVHAIRTRTRTRGSGASGRRREYRRSGSPRSVGVMPLGFPIRPRRRRPVASVVGMDVAALVTAGATAIVGLMASDAWTYASGRLARLLGRTDTELRASRAELLLARADGDEAAAEQLQEGWRERLRTVLESDPAAVRELTELLDEVNPGWREAPQDPAVRNTISGGTIHGTVVQGRDFGPLTINQPPERRDGRGNSG